MSVSIITYNNLGIKYLYLVTFPLKRHSLKKTMRCGQIFWKASQRMFERFDYAVTRADKNNLERVLKNVFFISFQRFAVLLNSSIKAAGRLITCQI